MQSERPGSSIVELDEYLVCGDPDGGEAPQALLPRHQEYRFMYPVKVSEESHGRGAQCCRVSVLVQH